MPDLVIHGASSFLGRHLVKTLISQQRKFTVAARANSNLEYITDYNGATVLRYRNHLDEINFSEAKLSRPVFMEFSWQGVFGSERNDPSQYTVNIPLIISSLEVARKLNAAHWIGLGSQAEYGNLDKKISENDPCHPTTLYGKSKYFCSQMAEEVCKANGIEFTWLRLFSVYGPDDNHEWLIQYLIKKMLLNEEINVTKGEQLWDYLYVGDIVEMLLKLINSKGAGIANLGSGKGIPVKEIIEKIKTLTGSSSAINYGALPYRNDQVMFMEADIQKLTSHLNWHPATSLDQGLKATIDAHLKTVQPQ